ncbi:MAG TPA: RNA 2',3'-cyclic phosphodiesterase [Gaiellaceae bacterium]|nr:RNA 2',3'-cyclic phosphodiesterase [Gaiellaceae bacterium]
MTKERATAASVAGDDRVRLFCALQLGDDTLKCLTDWQAAALSAGRIVPRENLHITLAFLGHRAAAECEPIAQELRAAAARAGEIDLSVRGYRETRSVGMVTLDDGGRAATRLADDVQARLEALGVYRREARQWLPHVTVARSRGRGQERAGLRPEPPNTCSINVVRAALYRSFLGSGGARYEVLATAVLGGR